MKKSSGFFRLIVPAVFLLSLALTACSSSGGDSDDASPIYASQDLQSAYGAYARALLSVYSGTPVQDPSTGKYTITGSGVTSEYYTIEGPPLMNVGKYTITNYNDAQTGYTISGTITFSMIIDLADYSLFYSYVGTLNFSNGKISKIEFNYGMAGQDYSGTMTVDGVAYDIYTSMPLDDGRPNMVSFSVLPGKYDSAQSVSLSCPTSGASIRYTTDGTTPTASSTLYTGTPVAVSSSKVLKAVAVKNGLSSGVSAALYIIGSTGLSGWTRVTVDSGLAGNTVNRVRVSGSTICAATSSGLSVSTDGGSSWTNYTTSNGLVSSNVISTAVSGSSLFAGTNIGLSISTNGGISWTTYTSADGLPSNQISDIYIDGSGIYVGTPGGLSISTNGGTTWTTYTSGGGLADSNVRRVVVSNSAIYACTPSGLSVSQNGGSSWSTFSTLNGIISNDIRGIVVSGNNISLATGGGCSLSQNLGSTWTNYTNYYISSGSTVNLSTWGATCIAGVGSIYCIGTGTDGLLVSFDAGTTWQKYDSTSVLGDSQCADVVVDGTTIYAATRAGLAIYR